MAKRYRCFLLIAVLSSCNLLGESATPDKINGDVGAKTDASVDVGPECTVGTDCVSGVCEGGECLDARCADGLKNGSETDLDCGGSCSPCEVGMICGENNDCDVGACTNRICKAPSCLDELKNGNESDLDCGGDCPPCALESRCDTNADCESAACIEETCELGRCGDNIVNNSEECDGGGVNTATCDADCTFALCGDGTTNTVASETCDDGNTDTESCNYGEMNCTVCEATCTSVAGVTSYCGDGATDIENNEECDDANQIDTDNCKNNCTLGVRRVFVTSQPTQGNFGGLSGGDAYCQSLAGAAGLSGTYFAWLSDNTGTPAERFSQSTVPYHLVDGTLIANNWADLIDGSIANPINLTEQGNTPPDSSSVCGYTTTVWSNTLSDGTIFSVSNHCTDWTGAGVASWGRWTAITGNWSRACNGGSCTSVSNLFCFEQ